MPIAHKNSSNISDDFVNQIKNNISKPADISSLENEMAEVKTQTSATAASSAEPKKGKYADVMNIRLSEGRRDEIKKFCTNCGVTVTQYIEASFEFLEKEVAAGRIVISKGGISKTDRQ